MFPLLPTPLRLLPPAVLLVAACAAVALGFAPPSLAATPSGAGTTTTETRTPGDFQAVAVSGAIDVVVRQAAANAVTVTADDELLPLVETVVEDGRHGRTLKIRLQRGERVRTGTPVKVSVDAVRLAAIAVAGSGDLRVEAMDTPRLSVALAGASDAVLRGLRTDALELKLSGSCDLQAEGTAGRLSLAIAGSGDADLAGLVADVVTVSIAGSGDAQVVAERSLRASIAGSGDVRYRGAATQVTSSIAGSGSVRRH